MSGESKVQLLDKMSMLTEQAGDISKMVEIINDRLYGSSPLECEPCKTPTYNPFGVAVVAEELWCKQKDIMCALESIIARL